MLRYLFISLYILIGSSVLLPISSIKIISTICLITILIIHILLLQAKHRTSQFIINALKEGICLIKNDGKILLINRRARRIIKHQHTNEAYKNLNTHPFFQDLKTISQKVLNTYTPQVITKNNIDITFKTLPHKQLLLVSFVDSHQNYQQKIMGKEFVANASHELRTPITIIKGFAETIYDMPSISENMLSECIQKIVNNCQRMDYLIKNLLTLANLDYLPKAKLQHVDLVGLIDGCHQTLLSMHPNINIESFHNESIIIINGDPDLLELALMNLLENAIKYSSSTSLLTTTISLFEGKTELAISDSGIGIASEDIPNIFDRFYTVNRARCRQLGGAGLGLSIVKSILDKHDVSITATSKLGIGSTFTLTFPPNEQHQQLPEYSDHYNTSSLV